MKRVAKFLLILSGVYSQHSGAQPSQFQTTLKAPQNLAEKQPAKDWNGAWKMGLAGTSYEDQQSSSALVNVRLGAMLRYYLNEDLLFKFTPVARLQSGSTQSSRGELSPENKVYFNEASATWRALPALFLKAGALDQGELHSPLVVESRPFPGARASLLFKNRNYKYGLSLESAVPTSVSLTTNQTEKEPTPSFNTAAVRFEWSDPSLWSFSSRAGIFEYSNLNSKIAAESYMLGNSAAPYSDTEYRFNIPYRGVEAQMRLGFPLGGPMDAEIGGDFVQNTAAESQLNQGWRVEGKISFDINSRSSVFFSGNLFRVEPDAAVASFVDSRFSGTNRNGFGGEAGLSFGKRKSLVVGGFRETDLIYLNDRQTRDRFVYLGLETQYAAF